MITFVDVCGEELGKVSGERKVCRYLREDVKIFAPGRRRLFVNKKECLDGETIPAGAVVVVSPKIYRPASEWTRTFSPSTKDTWQERPFPMPVQWLFLDVTVTKNGNNAIVPHALSNDHPFNLCTLHANFCDLATVAGKKLNAFPVGVVKRCDIVVSIYRLPFAGSFFLAISDIKLKE